MAICMSQGLSHLYTCFGVCRGGGGGGVESEGGHVRKKENYVYIIGTWILVKYIQTAIIFHKIWHIGVFSVI